MPNPKEAIILSHLRQEGRIALTEISRKTGLPVSTIFDRICATKAINRYTLLLNFSALGFGCRALILIRTTKDMRSGLCTYLIRHPYVNTLHRINNGHDFCIEGIFIDMGHLERFVEQLEEQFPIKDIQTHYLLEELAREGFLRDEHLAVQTLSGTAAPPLATGQSPRRLPAKDINTHRRQNRP